MDLFFFHRLQNHLSLATIELPRTTISFAPVQAVVDDRFLDPLQDIVEHSFLQPMVIYEVLDSELLALIAILEVELSDNSVSGTRFERF